MEIGSTGIAEHVAEVEDRISAACAHAGRARSEVTLVAVSKTHPIDAIREAIDSGISDLGENRAVEFRDKFAVLGNAARWHFVGNLQTNKVRFVVGKASLIHSVDRYGLAEAISHRAQTQGVVQDALLEVNVSGEATKHGCDPARAPYLCEQVEGLAGIRLRGSMTMAPFYESPEDARPYFAQLRELNETLRAGHPDMIDLSMGMTGDFEVAIAEGATIVRIGTAIFGARSSGASPV